MNSFEHVFSKPRILETILKMSLDSLDVSDLQSVVNDKDFQELLVAHQQVQIQARVSTSFFWFSLLNNVVVLQIHVLPFNLNKIFQNSEQHTLN